MMVVVIGPRLAAIAGGLGSGQAGVVVVEIIPIALGVAALRRRRLDDGEALHPTPCGDHGNAALVGYGNNGVLVGFMG